MGFIDFLASLDFIASLDFLCLLVSLAFLSVLRNQKGRRPDIMSAPFAFLPAFSWVILCISLAITLWQASAPWLLCRGRG